MYSILSEFADETLFAAMRYNSPSVLKCSTLSQPFVAPCPVIYVDCSEFMSLLSFCMKEYACSTSEFTFPAADVSQAQSLILDV